MIKIKHRTECKNLLLWYNNNNNNNNNNKFNVEKIFNERWGVTL